MAFHGQIEVDDTKTTDHFESIQVFDESYSILFIQTENFGVNCLK